MKYTYSILLTNRIASEQIISLRSIAAVGFFVLFVVAAAFAAPPANDNFASAQVITGLSGQATGTTAQATIEALEPSHALNKGGRSIWFKYVAMTNGVLAITTQDSAFNTTLAVYRGTALENLEIVGANDDSVLYDSSSQTSSVRIGVESGRTYYIAVDGYNNGSAASFGAVVLNYLFTNVAPNDDFANAIAIAPSKASLVTSNVGATKEAGEPNHAGNQGGKSVWFKFITAPDDMPISYTFVANSANLESTAPVYTLMAAYTGSSVSGLTKISESLSTGINKLVFNTLPGTTYYIAVDGMDIGGAVTGTITLSFNRTKNPKQADFDNDGKADIAVFRPSTGYWYSLDSITGKLRSLQFGASSDIPLIADIGQDGIMDHTAFRPNGGVWYLNESRWGFTARVWGMNGDIPLFNKYNNQNYTGLAIFRPTNGTWWLYDGSNMKGFQFGQNGDIPVFADFNGDGIDDPTVFRPSNGVWYIMTDQTTGTYKAAQFGQAGDIPVPADYDADGITDIAVFRPDGGIWWILKSSNNSPVAKQFGLATDKPQPADYDGDGRDDLAVYRDGVWWIQNPNGSARAVQFGLQGDIPMTSPFK